MDKPALLLFQLFLPLFYGRQEFFFCLLGQILPVVQDSGSASEGEKYGECHVAQQVRENRAEH